MGYRKEIVAALILLGVSASSSSIHTPTNILSEAQWRGVLSELGYKENVDETVALLGTEQRNGKWYGWILIGNCIGSVEQSSPRTKVFVLSSLGGYRNLTLDQFQGTLASIRNVPADELKKAFVSKEIERSFKDRCLPLK
ncbi:MAG TPA: hypothetical protein VFZ48_00035 [Candidatus Saccharimonadales bacterium]